jgi:hypothetical protein
MVYFVEKRRYLILGAFFCQFFVPFLEPIFNCLNSFLNHSTNFDRKVFIAVSNFFPAGPLGNGNIITQSNLAQCMPFQKNTTFVLTNDQVNYPYTVIY